MCTVVRFLPSCVDFSYNLFGNTQVGQTAAVPFLLEAKLKELGAEFSCGDPWSPFVVVDGRVVTGQNPQSSELTAKKVLEILASA